VEVFGPRLERVARSEREELRLVADRAAASVIDEIFGSLRERTELLEPAGIFGFQTGERYVRSYAVFGSQRSGQASGSREPSGFGELDNTSSQRSFGSGGATRLAPTGFRPRWGEPSRSDRRGFGLRGTNGTSGFDRVSALRERTDSGEEVASAVDSSGTARWLGDAFGRCWAAQADEMAASGDQRQEGIGVGDGARPRGGSKALKGQTP
jgi:hypothetical protein